MKKTHTTKRPAASTQCAGIKFINAGQGAFVEVRGPWARLVRDIAKRNGIPEDEMLNRILEMAFGKFAPFGVGATVKKIGPFADYLCDVARASMKLARNDRETCEAEAIIELLWNGYAAVGPRPLSNVCKGKAKR